MMLRPSFVVGLGAITLAVALGWGTAGGPVTLAAAGQEEAASPVRLARIEAGTAEDLYRTPAELRFARDVKVLTRVSGRVQELAVADGAQVSRGDVLVRFEDEDARADLEAARERLSEAQAQFERADKLVQQGQLASAALAERRQTLENVRAGVNEAEHRLQDFIVQAPFDGEIHFIDLPAGAVVQAGEAIADLNTSHAMKAVFDLPERYAEQITPAQQVRLFQAGGQGGEGRPVAQGEIVLVGTRPEGDRQIVRVEAQLSRIDRPLEVGEPVTVEVILATRVAVPFLPQAAILHDGPKAKVYLVDPGSVAHLTAVDLGQRRGDSFEVLSGLNVGDRVVVGGLQQVWDGAEVGAAAGEATGQP